MRNAEGRILLVFPTSRILISGLESDSLLRTRVQFKWGSNGTELSETGSPPVPLLKYVCWYRIIITAQPFPTSASGVPTIFTHACWYSITAQTFPASAAE